MLSIIQKSWIGKCAVIGIVFILILFGAYIRYGLPVSIADLDNLPLNTMVSVEGIIYGGDVANSGWCDVFTSYKLYTYEAFRRSLIGESGETTSVWKTPSISIVPEPHRSGSYRIRGRLRRASCQEEQPAFLYIEVAEMTPINRP